MCVLVHKVQALTTARETALSKVEARGRSSLLYHSCTAG